MADAGSKCQKLNDLEAGQGFGVSAPDRFVGLIWVTHRFRIFVVNEKISSLLFSTNESIDQSQYVSGTHGQKVDDTEI